MRYLTPFPALVLLLACGGGSSTQVETSSSARPSHTETAGGAQSDDRLERVATVVRSLPAGEQETAAAVALALAQIDGGAREPVARLVLSLESPRQSAALQSLLEIFPRAAAGVEHLFIKGMDSGTVAQVEAFRRCCPNLRTFWGYVGTFPTDAAPHMGRWADDSQDGASGRGILDGLQETEHVALWSRDGGYLPPPQ